MSFSDAVRTLRSMGKRLPWMERGDEQEIEAPDPVLTAAQQVSELVRMASGPRHIEPQSATWLAVKGWAAEQLLQTMLMQERAGDDEAARLRVRASVLRDLMAIEKPEQVVKWAEDVPVIP